MTRLGAKGKKLYQESQPRMVRDFGPAFAAAEGLIAKLYRESCCQRWGVALSEFKNALECGARKRFGGEACSPESLSEFLGALHVEDLGLACACMHGSEAAWEYFVREYRGYLRAAGNAITKGSPGGADGQELADSLFAELYGLADGKRGERSLFRYFHGRSSLKTWLRAILAQRHVDKLRENRRWEALQTQDGEEASGLATSDIAQQALDPHRQKYVRRFCAALAASVRALEPEDRQRIELYYAREKTLAEIGRFLGEHESSVSRNLERIRRELRVGVEERLRGVVAVRDGAACLPGLSEAEIALCFEYAAEEVPIDFGKLFPEKDSEKPGTGRKDAR